jgi:hypothetical protein
VDGGKDVRKERMKVTANDGFQISKRIPGLDPEAAEKSTKIRTWLHCRHVQKPFSMETQVSHPTAQITQTGLQESASIYRSILVSSE